MLMLAVAQPGAGGDQLGWVSLKKQTSTGCFLLLVLVIFFSCIKATANEL